MMSVGIKVVARVAAEWNAAWLTERQQGFREGRGTTGAATAVRRMMEEGREAVGGCDGGPL